MAPISLTQALRHEYVDLFNSCAIPEKHAPQVEKAVAGLLTHQARYQALAGPLGIPWQVIAVIHAMESSQNFSKHLHNGDPLTARTVREPAGRPKTGQPPFTWEHSATDALAIKKLGPTTDWSLAGTLYQLERYNGFGYRLYHPHVLSPYLWGLSTHYICGKYTEDSTWSDTAVSKQCGAAVMLRRLAEKGLISFVSAPSPAPTATPLAPSHATTPPDSSEEQERVTALQIWLNTFPDIFVKVDGIPGDLTSAAYRKVTGFYLPGDPRA
ncbi:hypothetical protein [Desulfolutivibrio sulfoxidireducens]|uniref:hypothetical protein n=1 Tax=Desulfolutivibrio sulfoxidireducens TaxID=2773299 RepID=UPI00159DD114|nr:hypothetical protein [Desulfolutivibrio sulfoxidireducens]QLA21083.1 hypothetical protein GD604_15830 [Desulfolutivibrio sulfoxidireducens]